MFRKPVTTICKRLYHDSNFRQKMPVVKQASSRVLQKNRDRLDHFSKPKVDSYDPSKRFEPFPYQVTEENRLEVLKKIISPLHDVPYDEQLESKQSYCRNALRYLAQRLFKSGTPVRLDVRRLPCIVHPIVRCPELYNYRNKDEFSIWRGLDGKTVTVGFNVFPISKHGDTVCLEPNGCDIMTPEVTRLSDILQEFIRNHAKLSVCFSLGTDGGWRRFIIRCNLKGELMLIGIASPRNLRVREVIDERENFRDFMVQKCKEQGLNLKSLYFQPCPHNNCDHKTVPYELLYGDKTLKEKINEFTIEVSPESYFTQNTKGAEVLFNTVRKTVEDCFGYQKSNIKPLVIDVSCGVGILGFHLAGIASKLVGIDNSEQAIDDARANAKLNGFKEAEFICSNVEIVLERVLDKYSRHRNETLIVCNPPKRGLHHNVVEVLRNCADVKKIIYVTPDPGKDQVVENLLDLCKRVKGRSIQPFAPVSATPVDVYPHLVPCELVIALERLPE